MFFFYVGKRMSTHEAHPSPFTELGSFKQGARSKRNLRGSAGVQRGGERRGGLGVHVGDAESLTRVCGWPGSRSVVREFSNPGRPRSRFFFIKITPP